MTNKIQERINELKEEKERLEKGLSIPNIKNMDELKSELKGFTDCLKMVQKEIENIELLTGYELTCGFCVGRKSMNRDLLKSLEIEEEK